MLVFTTIQHLQAFLAQQNNKKIALVPTMGSLHLGHLSLVQKAKEVAEIVVVSIFVNKKQFNNLTDYQSYPKHLSADLNLLQQQKVDVVFAPDETEMFAYGNENNFTISPHGDLENCLCGKFRFGHFAGVCLIVTKLFNIVKPNFAIFGEKDFQQLTIIKKMVDYFNFDLKIISAPTIRNEKGLALSSRNALLSQNDLLLASKIYQALLKVAKNPTEIENIKNQLLRQGFSLVEYLEIRNSCNLSLIDPTAIHLQKQPTRVFIAVVLEGVRLIDNFLIDN